MATIKQLNEPEPVTEELALVNAAKAGDIGSFEELVRRYDRNVFRIAQHITQNREDAEDVVQDAFLKAYENLKQFQGQSKFYTWLVRIAVNEALMKLRKRRPERFVSLDEDVKTEEDSMPREIADWSPNPEQQYNQAELKDILGKTIQGLPTGFRTVFVLRDVEKKKKKQKEKKTVRKKKKKKKIEKKRKIYQNEKNWIKKKKKKPKNTFQQKKKKSEHEKNKNIIKKKR